MDAVNPAPDPGPVERAARARERLTEASVELWNLRLRSLREAGDVRGLLAHLTQPLESGCDNCSCNQGCNSCLQALDALVARTEHSR